MVLGGGSVGWDLSQDPSCLSFDDDTAWRARVAVGQGEKNHPRLQLWHEHSTEADRVETAVQHLLGHRQRRQMLEQAIASEQCLHADSSDDTDWVTVWPNRWERKYS